jgi:transposase
MPPQRSVLGTISGNRAFNYQLSPYQRGRILGLTEGGIKSSNIQNLLDVSRGAVESTLKREHLRNEGNTQARSGRPREYTDTTERKILRHVRLHPKDTYTQLILACELSIKKTTIKTILTRHGITNWRARRRPFLTEKNTVKRLAWCLKHQGLTEEEWGMYMWSDECSVERGRGKRDEWVFRTANQAWDRDMVQTYNCKKNMKVMVWGCFWDLGRTSLYIMDRDFESLKHGYSAESYLEVLDAEVAPVYSSLDPGYVFIQDNASIYTARKVKVWFQENRVITLTNWPPYSLDLNLIEHIW